MLVFVAAICAEALALTHAAPNPNSLLLRITAEGPRAPYMMNLSVTLLISTVQRRLCEVRSAFAEGSRRVICCQGDGQCSRIMRVMRVRTSGEVMPWRQR
eukprot:4209265-Pleurochrysis_carterae.AAC.1